MVSIEAVACGLAVIAVLAMFAEFGLRGRRKMEDENARRAEARINAAVAETPEFRYDATDDGWKIVESKPAGDITMSFGQSNRSAPGEAQAWWLRTMRLAGGRVVDEWCAGEFRYFVMRDEREPFMLGTIAVAPNRVCAELK